MTIIIYPVNNHQKWPVRDTRNVTDIFPCLWKSKKDEPYVFCSTCERDFSCARDGKGDCRRHDKSKSDLNFEKVKMTQMSLSSFCKTAELDRTRAVTKVEAMICHPITTLNLLSSSADLFSNYFKVMFTDSKISSGEKNVWSKSISLQWICSFRIRGTVPILCIISLSFPKLQV